MTGICSAKYARNAIARKVQRPPNTLLYGASAFKTERLLVLCARAEVPCRKPVDNPISNCFSRMKVTPQIIVLREHD